MKATDLMIGDWVYNLHHKCNIKITPFDFFTHGHTESGEQYLSGYAKIVSGKDFEPIPLTPEILEKNGFEKNSCSRDDYYSISSIIELMLIFNRIAGIWQCYYDSSECVISIESPKRAIIRNDCCLIIKYVHELQHALRLCGIEKEIEL